MDRAHDDEFGNHLLLLRTRVALTQIALAKEIKVHRRSVQNWESGVAYPKAETLLRLMTALLDHDAFTTGNEYGEARRLWEQAQRGGPHALVAFDDAWFAHTLTAHLTSPTPAHAPAHKPPSSNSIIDWGEALAVPRLVGRESEMQTLRQWIVEEHCRVVTIVGLGGMGKSSLALTAAHQLQSSFDLVMFRSLRNAPALAEVLEQTIRAVAEQPVALPDTIPDRIALLVRLFRERRCLFILDNLETILLPGALTGSYRPGYADYGTLLHALSERQHDSCLLLTTREKPAEVGAGEGRAGPVRTLTLSGLNDDACRVILAAKDIDGTVPEVSALARLYGGNPLALTLVAEAIREVFGGDVGAFLGTGDVFFHGVGVLMAQQCARSTPVERSIMRWLAIERELVPLSNVLANLSETVAQRDVLGALESLRRRTQIERAPDRPAFTLQPVILEFLTEQIVDLACQEIVAGQPQFLLSHPLMQATATDYVRRSQERLIATPVLERLVVALGDAATVERQLMHLLAVWRGKGQAEVGFGPGNIINLLHLLRGHLRGLNMARLSIRQAYLQGVDAQNASLAGATIVDSRFTGTFDSLVSSVATNSSGTHWAIGSRRGGVQVWSAEHLTLQHEWPAHSDMVRSLAFSPDGRTLATSGSWDGTVKLWDMHSGTLLWSHEHATYTRIVVFTPDGRMLASSGNDATVRLWDARTGAQVYALPHPDPVTAMAWSADSRRLASGDATGHIRFWDVHETAQPTCVFSTAGHANVVEALAFAPDGSVLASGSWDSTVKLWNATTGQTLQTLSGHSERLICLAWSPDGAILASAGRDQTIRLWEGNRFASHTVLHAHTAEVNGLAFIANSRSLLSCSEDGTLRVWDVARGQVMYSFHGYADALYDVDWSPTSTRLAAGGSNALVTIFDLAEDAAPAILQGHTGAVLGVGWSSDGQYVASSEWHNTIRLWDSGSGVCLRVLRQDGDPDNFFDGLAWSPDGRRLALGTYTHGIEVFASTEQSQPVPAQDFPAWIRRVAWRPDGVQIAAGGADGAVYIFDAGTNMLRHRLVGHRSSITSVAWSPDGACLASGSTGPEGGELFVWDIERGELRSMIVEQPEVVYALAWGATADVLVSGGRDGRVRWWDLRRGTCIHVQAAHHGTVQAIRRSPDGTKLASCGDDGAIFVWNLSTGEYLQTLRRDRPYERMDITGLVGMSATQRAALIALGALDGPGTRPTSSGESTRRTGLETPPADDLASDERDLLRGLPVQTTSFVGRNAEISELTEVLNTLGCRLLTLFGPGGIGKTRLATEVAVRQAGSFSDGIGFVALATVASSDQIVLAIAENLGLALVGQSDPTTYLLDWLRARHMLLLLDGFEHLLAGADLVSTILARAPRVTILATSRARLNIRAEWLYEVHGLDFPLTDALDTVSSRPLASLTDYSAVQLFVERATQIQPRFTLTDTAHRSIVHICRQVAGMPLAIELAAASIRLAPLAEIERQINANLDVLATTHRDVPERHRSLRAVFDHSWELLDAQEQALLSRLAVFRGGSTAEAVEQVATATLPLLTSLVDKSLLRRERAEWRPNPGYETDNTTPEPRFVLLEPIREFALEHLLADEVGPAVQHAHAAYFLALAEAAAEHWDSSAAAAWIARLDREQDNLRAALQWASESGDRTVGLLLGAALRKYWRRRGAISEGRGWLEELLRLADAPAGASATLARARALDGAAWLASDQHDFARANQYFAEAAVLRRALGEPEDDTQLLINYAVEARVTGQYQHATETLEDLVARQRALGDRRSLSNSGLGLSIFLLGLVRREQGDFAGAATMYEACVDLHHSLKDAEGVALGLLGLSDIARDQGDSVQVRMYADKSLARLRTLGVQWAIGFALNNLSLADLHEGHLARANTLVNESVSTFREQNADGSLAEVLITQGQIALAQGDRTAAYVALTEALRLARAVGPRLLVFAALDGLGTLAAQNGQAALAIRLLGVASTLRAKSGTPRRPVDQPAVEQALTIARTRLGAEDFATAWRVAREVPVDEILDLMPTRAMFTAHSPGVPPPHMS